MARKNYKKLAQKRAAAKSGPKLTSTVSVPASSASSTSKASGTTKKTTSSRRATRAAGRARAEMREFGFTRRGGGVEDLLSGTWSRAARKTFSGS